MRNQVVFFLPTYSLLMPKSAHTSERVNAKAMIMLPNPPKIVTEQNLQVHET